MDRARGLSISSLHQVQTTGQLLEAGFAVLTPEAKGSTFRYTSVLPYEGAWQTALEHLLMLALLNRIEGGAFDSLDVAHVPAHGLSNGGYMSS